MPHSEASSKESPRATTVAVSVVIPAYNVAPYIADTLDSVFAQTCQDYEVILVNDGSPDTAELERALEPYIERLVYLKQENRGAAAARNEGIRRARGRFVAFLDADDIWLPIYLKEQLEFISEGGYDLVYADALLFGDSPLAGRTFMETAPSDGPVTFESLITGRCNVITSGVLVRRQVLLDAGLFDEGLRNSQDFDLWLRLVRGGARAAYQRRVLLRYRFHEDSLSGDALNRINRELRVLAKYEQLSDLKPDERAAITETMARLRSELELETGKLALARGDFAAARSAFSKAGRFGRSGKLLATRALLRLAPHTLRRLYLRRVDEASRGKR